MHPFSGEFEFQHSFFEVLLRVIAFGFPAPAVPELDSATAILSFGNGTFKGAVFQRMILDFHGEAFGRRIGRGNLCDGPGLVNAVEFEPQVEMQPCRSVALNHEAKLFGLAPRDLPARFGGDVEIAFCTIGLKACHQCRPEFHGAKPRWRTIRKLRFARSAPE